MHLTHSVIQFGFTDLHSVQDCECKTVAAVKQIRHLIIDLGIRNAVYTVLQQLKKLVTVQH